MDEVKVILLVYGTDKIGLEVDDLDDLGEVVVVVDACKRVVVTDVEGEIMLFDWQHGGLEREFEI